MKTSFSGGLVFYWASRLTTDCIYSISPICEKVN
nr:MAG TPA: hypothetical protein [Caudoviricetes sp.]